MFKVLVQQSFFMGQTYEICKAFLYVCAFEIYSCQIQVNLKHRNVQMPKVIDNYVLEDKIGHGQFGDVYSGFNQDTKLQVAIKTIKRQTIKGKFYELLQNEIKVLKTCDNPYIMKLYALKKTANHYYLILEYCNGGDILGKLKKVKRIPENQVIKYFCQILTGFQTLVKHKIMHRDFKLPNILLHDDNIKIADFGFSKLLNSDDYATTMLGSPLNMAPQVLGGNKYNNKADIWSIGACIYEMIYGKPPYTANNMVDLLKNINSKPLQFPADVNINSTLKDVLKKMLVPDVKRRISWNDLFSHPINRYLDSLIRKEIDLELIQDESLMINTSKFYIKKNLVINKPQDIEEKAKMNEQLVGIINNGQKTNNVADQVIKQEEKEQNFTEQSTPVKSEQKSSIQSKNDSPSKKQSPKRHQNKQEFDGEPQTDPEPQNKSTVDQKRSSKKKAVQSSNMANYSHIYRKNSKKVLFYRNIYAFLASTVDDTIQMDEQGNDMAAYMMIKQILKTIEWLKETLESDQPSKQIQGLQRWSDYKQQVEYSQVKEYIQREQNVFKVFAESLESTVKEKCIKGELGKQERKVVMGESTDKQYKKYLLFYVKSLTKKTLGQSLFTKDFNSYRKYWKHIEQVLICLNYKRVFQDETIDFTELYKSAEEGKPQDVLLRVEKRLIDCQ